MEYGGKGEIRLTDYALSHIDECCFGFVIGSSERHTSFEGHFVSMTKRRVGNSSVIEGSIEPIRPDEIERFLVEAEEFGALEKGMHEATFEEALFCVLERKGWSLYKLLQELGGQEKSTAKRWFTQDVVPLNVILAICVVLDLRYETGKMLVEAGGHSFRSIHRYHVAKQILHNTNRLTLKSLQEILNAANMGEIFPKNARELGRVRTTTKTSRSTEALA